jgi:hypothetical protein
MKINDIVTESWSPDKEYPDTEQGAIECFTDISEYKPNEVTKVYPDPYTPYVWAIHTNTKRYGPQKHVVWINEKDFATDDRSGEEDFRVNESTTSGSIATVAAPMTTQSRNASIYGGKKGGNLLTGKKTNKKYANSISEGKMKELAIDIRDMDNGNFKKKYGKSKEQLKFTLGDPQSKKTVHENMDTQPKKQLLRYADAFRMLEILEKAGVNVLEVRPGGETTARFVVDINGRHHLLTMNKQGQLSEAQLEEDDLILVPGQGHRLKSGFIPHDQDRTDHEVEMAKSDLFQAAKNAKQVYEIIADVSEEEGLPGWVQEKIIKANDYLNTVREYLEHKQVQEMTGGVIAGGGVGEGRVNEAQSMGTALKNTLAKAEPGSKLDNSIKAHNRDIKNGGKGTLKNAPTGYHFDKKGYCRLGDK